MTHHQVSCIDTIVRTARSMRSDVRAEKPVFRTAAVGREGGHRQGVAVLVSFWEKCCGAAWRIVLGALLFGCL